VEKVNAKKIDLASIKIREGEEDEKEIEKEIEKEE
jgi:hypothetical protein